MNLKFFPISFLFLVTLLTSFSVFAHKISSWEKILILYKNGDCLSVVKHLKPILKTKSSINKYLLLRSNILYAKCEIELGNYKEALKILNDLKGKDFYDVVVFQKIRALLKSGKNLQAFEQIRKLIKHPKKIFYLRLLRDEIKKEIDSDEEIKVLFPFLNDTKKNQGWFLTDFEINKKFLRGAELNGINLDSKYQLLGWQFPIDEKSARQSEKKLNTKDLKTLSSAQILTRVRTLENLGLYKYLIDHIQIFKISKDKKLLNKLGESYLKSLFKELFYSRIINNYKDGTLSKKWSLSKESQLFWTARSYLKRKNISDAKTTIYKLERLNAKDKRLPILFDAIASRYMLDSETSKAQFWWEKLIKNFPKHKLTKKSFWLLSWTNIQGNNYEKAIINLKKVLKIKIYNSEMKAKLQYWLGKIYQKSGKTELAKKNFKKLILKQPNTYYGMRLLSSENTLKDIFDTKISEPNISFNEPDVILSNETKSIFRRSNFLFDIFEPEQAKEELFSELGSFKNKKLNWNACLLLKKRDEYNSILRIIANTYLSKMIKLEIGKSPLWKLAYPRPYWNILRNYSSQAGIDPYFALAIMREESHFDPNALSSSKAMGLMQLMPATAKDIAKRKKLKLIKKEEIFDPKFNIHLGTYYLGQLAKKFQSELIYTAGGYNAGPHNMKKWINRWNGISIDEFVEKIPFKETRNYVKRVFRSYKIYKKIYSS